jgi:hypothetical protein
MNTRKILLIVLMPLFIVALTTGCSKEDEAITFSVVDVSSRITGFSNQKAGTGATLTINGTQLDRVQRLAVGEIIVPAKNFVEVTESSLTFTVPSSAAIGVNDILLVFPGQERAFSSIEVVPFQAITGIQPPSATAGETVSVFGANLETVTEVRLGTVAATISSQTPSLLRFTVPAGITTGPITLVSSAGVANSTVNLIACEGNSSQFDCAPGLNLNAGFELGEGDVFTNWSKLNGGTRITATTSINEVFRGSRAMKVTRDGLLDPGEWRIQLLSDLVTMEVGASYTVFMWVKASAAGGSLRVSTQPSPRYTANQNVPTTWTRLAFTFTANVAQTGIALDMNGNNTVATTFFVDDVKLVKN